MSDLSASDVALMDRDGDGFGNGGMWIFALIILLVIGGGGFWGNNRNTGEAVTEADLCSANSFNELKGSVGRLNDQIANAYTGVQNGLSTLGYTTLENFNNVQRQLSECCCTTQRGIDGVNYANALNTASINANTTAVGQKILDTLCENKMEAMQSKINQLELQSALAGVVRYPSAITYNGGASPFCNCNSCCTNI